jgi:hypothetical protein
MRKQFPRYSLASKPTREVSRTMKPHGDWNVTV